MQKTKLDGTLSQTQQLKLLRLGAGETITGLANKTRLSRLTVAAAEGKSDPKLSTIAALLDELGYELVPVPKRLKAEVIDFVNNGGLVVTLPAGVVAPLGGAQKAFADAEAGLGKGDTK